MNSGPDHATQIPQPPPDQLNPMGPDLLRGADQIAEFIFGTTEERRKIYHLAETSKIPVFRLGALLCARKSKLMSWIEAQENRALKD